MRLIVILILIIGLSYQITYCADDIYVNAHYFNMITGSRYYKGINKVEIHYKGKYTDGTGVTIKDTRVYLGEDKIEGKTLLVSKLESSLAIGNANPIRITSYDYYDLDGGFLYSFIKELNTKRIEYDVNTIVETILIGKKYVSSMKNSDGSIEITELTASTFEENIAVNSKSYIIKNDQKTISCYSNYILLNNGDVKQINLKLVYPNTTLDITSYNIIVDKH